MKREPDTTSESQPANGVLDQAIAFHSSGQLSKAETLYRQLLVTEPDHPQVLHQLGVLYHQLGKHESAIDLIERAIALDGDQPTFHSNLGESYRAVGRISDAIICLHRALQLDPGFAGAYYNLGNILKAEGRLEEAIDCFQQALKLRPDYHVAANNLGNTWKAFGQPTQAIANYQRALRSNPNFVEAHRNLGEVYRTQGMFDEAFVCFRRVLELKPGLAEAHHELGRVLQDQGKQVEAVECYRRALELKPDFPETYFYLGNIYSGQGNVDQAIACYSRSLEFKPGTPEVLLNLGGAFKEQGNLEEAIKCYRQAADLRPDFAEAHSNVVYSLLFSPNYDEKRIFAEHQQWSQTFENPLANFIRPHTNQRSSDRRLRIGYVSPDFCDHVVGRNLIPLFRKHDHQQFEIVCYSDSNRRDEFSLRFKGYADVWHECSNLSDEHLANLIREDQIDILVDLTLHMSGNRMLVFARKPAPIQITFAGYPGTTGLTTVDYRLTDPYLDSPDRSDRYYSEKTIRLPNSFWCYDPLINEHSVNDLPAKLNGFVTFGCLNNFCKVSLSTLQRWLRVLQAVPDSRLLLRATTGSSRLPIIQLFEQGGVSADRVSFVDRMPRQQYMELYHQIDIGLDTLPYNGHTTSLDSLWMGVPVITLVGETVVGRAGLSQLMNLGLSELIARTSDQFVNIAIELSDDRSRLSQLRTELRERMRGSPLMDAAGFARGIETSYCEVWQRWCAKSD